MPIIDRRFISGGVAGAVIAAAAVLSFQPLDRGIDIGKGLQGAAHPLEPFELEEGLVKSGSPKFSMTKTWVSPDGLMTIGVWACEGPGTFDFVYTTDETIYLLDGHADIDYEGSRLTLEPGDTAHFTKGTTAHWHVANKLRKVYAVQRPSRARQWWDQLL